MCDVGFLVNVPGPLLEHLVNVNAQQRLSQSRKQPNITIPKGWKMDGRERLPSPATTMANGNLMDRAGVTTSAYVSGTGR